MKLIVCSLLILTFVATSAHSDPSPSPSFYRSLTEKVRTDGHFRVYMPGGQHQDVKYHFKLGHPIYEEPNVHPWRWESGTLWMFWDRIRFEDESYLEIGGERLPLTCIFISGQDNRNLKKSNPLFPDYILRVFLVANDYACQGPIRPGWPETGGRKENWHTYLHYEVRDPTIMLPQDAVVRYFWNESSAVLIDTGNVH